MPPPCRHRELRNQRLEIRNQIRNSIFFVLLQFKSFVMDIRTILIVIVLAVAVVGIMVAGLGTKMLFRKEKEFKRPCTNADPKTGRCAHCTCGKDKGNKGK